MTAVAQVHVDTAAIIQQVLHEHGDTTKLFAIKRPEFVFWKNVNRQIDRQLLIGHLKNKTYHLALTSADKAQLLNSLTTLSSFTWQATLLPDLTFVDLDSLTTHPTIADTIMERSAAAGKTLYNIEGFSPPLFFDKGNQFIVLYVKYALILKTRAFKSVSFEIDVYRKEKGQWKRWLGVDGAISCY